MNKIESLFTWSIQDELIYLDTPRTRLNFVNKIANVLLSNIGGTDLHFHRDPVTRLSDSLHLNVLDLYFLFMSENEIRSVEAIVSLI